MRFLLVTTGSRGDTEPFVALARALVEAGHDPTVAGPERYALLAADLGVRYHPLDDRYLDLQDALAGGPRAVAGAMVHAKGLFEAFLDEVASLAYHPTDHVVYHPKTLVAPMIGERQGVPATAVQLIPLYRPTAAFPAPLTTAPVPRALNRASWRLVSAVEAPWRRAVNRVRHERFGLTGRAPSLANLIARHGSLDAWSPTLLPSPPDWPDAARPLGFWRLPDAPWTPPAALARFLAEGEAPVYIGFGSMVGRDPTGLGAAAVEGVRRAGRRALVVSGAGGARVEPADDVMVIDQAPHAWLMPRMAAAIHHGGVGTTASALLAGVPHVIHPFLGDQRFWADRVEALGVGTRVRGRGAAGFAAAAARALTCAAKAERVAPAVRAERGLERAVARLTAAE